MNRNLYFSACVTSALVAGVAFTSCNKDDVIDAVIPPDDRPSQSDGIKVFEYMPAPGQFINETTAAGGMTDDILTMEDAVEWAQKRLDANQFVSLGAFGGYIVIGFDHSIVAGGRDYDFYVAGNAFLTKVDGSNEPGIVWVMQDENGNGLPDDRWYELAGSDTFDESTRRQHSVTYYRPEAPGMDTRWVASDGTSGVVRYMEFFHKQDYYYPAWVVEDSYTLQGTLLSARNSQDAQTGYWTNASYDWGYADNMGSDNLPRSEASGNIQRNGFRIANAIDGSGAKVNLNHIDFVKVQTGVMAFSGALGEVSTEVCGVGEYLND